jgi:hypothetical protein
MQNMTFAVASSSVVATPLFMDASAAKKLEHVESLDCLCRYAIITMLKGASSSLNQEIVRQEQLWFCLLAQQPKCAWSCFSRGTVQSLTP